jgi:hypothetical protein
MPAFHPEQFCPTTVTVNVCIMNDSRAGFETSLRTCSRYRTTPVQCNPLAVATHFRIPAYIQSHSYWCSRERYGICVRISRIAALCTAFADKNNAGRPTIKRVLDHDCSGILSCFVLLGLRFLRSFVHLNSSALRVLCFWLDGCIY